MSIFIFGFRPYCILLLSKELRFVVAYIIAVSMIDTTMLPFAV